MCVGFIKKMYKHFFANDIANLLAATVDPEMKAQLLAVEDEMRSDDDEDGEYLEVVDEGDEGGDDQGDEELYFANGY